MPESNLEAMLASLTVTRREGEFVFVALDDRATPESGSIHALIRETEGMTAVVEKRDADSQGYEYDFVGAWLTLDIFSALEAVGLTATVSAALASKGIPANVIAGFHHDHIVVPVGRADDAIRCLAGLQAATVTE